MKPNDEFFSAPAQELLRHAVKPRRRTDAERERAARRLSPIAAGLSATLWAGKAIGMFAAIAIAGTVVSGVFLVLHRHRASHSSPSVATHSVSNSPHENVLDRDPVVPAPVALPVVASVVTLPGEVPPVVPTAHGVSHSAVRPVSTSASPGRENECLSSAQRSLATDPAFALRKVGQCAELFPNGSMAAERELLAIEALRAMGRNAQARRRAESYLTHFPSSIYAERVQHLIMLLSPSR